METTSPYTARIVDLLNIDSTSFDYSKLPSGVIYNMARVRSRYAASMQDTLKMSNWFFDDLNRHFTGRRAQWDWSRPEHLGSDHWKANSKCSELMWNFCCMTDKEVETLIVQKSTLDAARYSLKVKQRRLEPDVEQKFLELCKGKKSRFNALTMYCGKWDIMPENMTEITMIAGFDGGRRGKLGVSFMKKLAENKRRCRDLLTQIMKLEGIAEDEPIKKIMERLG